jgi:hypothetical protein
MKNKLSKIGLVIFFNLVLIEGLCAVFASHLFDKSYGSLSDNNEEITQYDPSQTINGPRQLHPFFGFTFKSDAEYMNNKGFQNTVDFPYVKKDREFVIGGFGGSLAQSLFSDHEAMEHLKQKLRPMITSMGYDKITIINYSIAAWRQPQQYFALLYFLPQIDWAITVDGFNEVANMEWMLSGGWGIDAPHPPIWGGMVHGLTPKRMVKITELTTAQNSIRVRSNWVRESLPGKTMTAQLLVGLLDRADQQIITANQGFLQSNWEDSGKDLSISSNHISQKTKQYVDDYFRYIKTGNQVAESLHKNSFFFLQPNQYTKNAKIFSAEEKSSAIGNNDFSDRVKRHYPGLISRFRSLESENFPAWTLTNVFEHESDSIYIDDCCHINERGNQLVASDIADKIIVHNMASAISH